LTLNPSTGCRPPPHHPWPTRPACFYCGPNCHRQGAPSRRTCFPRPHPCSTHPPSTRGQGLQRDPRRKIDPAPKINPGQKRGQLKRNPGPEINVGLRRDLRLKIDPGPKRNHGSPPRLPTRAARRERCAPGANDPPRHGMPAQLRKGFVWRVQWERVREGRPTRTQRAHAHRRARTRPARDPSAIRAAVQAPTAWRGRSPTCPPARTPRVGHVGPGPPLPRPLHGCGRAAPPRSGAPSYFSARRAHSWTGGNSPTCSRRRSSLGARPRSASLPGPGPSRLGPDCSQQGPVY